MGTKENYARMVEQPQRKRNFHAIAPLCLTPVHDVFNILMNEKNFNFPMVVATQLWQHDASLLMCARELLHNLAKIIVL